jgi:hypothetical protein
MRNRDRPAHAIGRDGDMFGNYKRSHSLKPMHTARAERFAPGRALEVDARRPRRWPTSAWRCEYAALRAERLHRRAYVSDAISLRRY